MHPTRWSTLTLVVAAVVFFFLSASGQSGQHWESGPSWLGWIGWIGFLICLLLLIISGVWALVAKMRGGGHKHVDL